MGSMMDHITDPTNVARQTTAMAGTLSTRHVLARAVPASSGAASSGGSSTAFTGTVSSRNTPRLTNGAANPPNCHRESL